MNLQIADSGGSAAGHHFRQIALMHGALDQGAGDHRSEAVHGEHPIHRQPEGNPHILLPSPEHHLVQLLPEHIDVLTGIGGDGDDGLALQEG